MIAPEENDNKAKQDMEKEIEFYQLGLSASPKLESSFSRKGERRRIEGDIWRIISYILSS